MVSCPPSVEVVSSPHRPGNPTLLGVARTVQRASTQSAPQASWTYAVTKRILDLFLASILLVGAAPLMLAIALCIRLDSQGPALFWHRRLGKGGGPFRCLKFRTMRVGAQRWLLADAELRAEYVENDFKIPADRDPRITRVGRYLRRSSLDELPQLLNVLAGHMSLVGPRPIVPEELARYGGHSDLFLSVKPGITGDWQVQGRSRVGYPARVGIELESIRRRSIWHDLVVLMKTIPAIISARGAF